MHTPAHPTVFVTGATGFLGHHLVDDLLAHGYAVRALVRDAGTHAATALDPRVERIVGDVVRSEDLATAMEGCDALFHCAGMVSRNPDKALQMHAVNVEGTQRTLSAARQAGIRRCVVASTSGVVAISEDADKVSTERDATPLALVNRFPYYRSKLYAEQSALEMNDAQMEVICVNPSLLLGPGDLHGSSTLDLQRFLERPTPIAPTGGVSFVDARDAAQAMRLALERGVAGQRYLLASCNCTVRTFFGKVARVAGASEPTFTAPGGSLVRKATMWLSDRARDVIGEDDRLPDAASLEMASYFWYVDAGKAERDLGWHPREPMTTLHDTIEDLRERGRIPLAHD